MTEGRQSEGRNPKARSVERMEGERNQSAHKAEHSSSTESTVQATATLACGLLEMPTHTDRVLSYPLLWMSKMCLGK